MTWKENLSVKMRTSLARRPFLIEKLLIRMLDRWPCLIEMWLTCVLGKSLYDKIAVAGIFGMTDSSSSCGGVVSGTFGPGLGGGE